MRRMLGVLRSEDDATDNARTTPAEGLRDVDRLMSQFRSAGLQVEATDLDHAADLPPALDISAYRIIQEGLTNVLRHGGPVAHLDIQRSPTQLRIEIRDDGRPRTPHRPHPARVTASPGSASGPPCSTARSRPNRRPAADSGSPSSCRSDHRWRRR